MRYLKIQNKGLLEMQLLFLMGGTTKSKDQFKIGQWGSGLKYSLAYLLKNNLDFKIFIGEKEVKVATVTETIRDEDFEIICIDGQRTSITTQMGGEAWKPWMIVRELWCNALDEGDHTREETSETEGREGYTTFYIQITPDIREIITNWHNYFIHEKEPMSEGDTYRIYAGGDKLRLYKQGVLIHEDPDRKSLFSYDIRNATINELREYNGVLSHPMVNALAGASEKVIEYYLENVTEQVYEGVMDYDWYVNFNDNWKTAIGNAKLIHPEALQNIQARGGEIDTATCIVVPEKVYKHLTKQFDGVGALRTADKLSEFYEIHHEELELRLKQGLAILETCGYYMHPELRIIYGIFGDKRVMAQINTDDKVIMVSEQMMDKPLFDFVTMLIEENEHFNTGFADHSREFQQHFIDKYASALLKMNDIIL